MAGAMENQAADGMAVEQLTLEARAIGEQEAPGRILVVPWGRVETAAGDFLVDEEAVGATIAAFRAHGTDVPVDYEHQTLGGEWSSPSGLAPAAGWVTALRAVSPEEATEEMPAGLWAEVEWTPEAAERLRGRQYRYLSPVALVRKVDRRLVGLHSVALTNKPAIAGMRPVVGSEGSVADTEAGLDGLRRLLGLGAESEEAAVLVAAAGRIRELEESEASRQAARRVSGAMAAGKLTGPQRAWAEALARRDPAGFDDWERSAPVVVMLGRLPGPAGAGVAGGGASAEGRAARAEYRANRAFLEKLCSEEAYVAAAERGG
jgi:phage I-like protein